MRMHKKVRDPIRRFGKQWERILILEKVLDDKGNPILNKDKTPKWQQAYNEREPILCIPVKPFTK